MIGCIVYNYVLNDAVIWPWTSMYVFGDALGDCD